MSEDCGGKRSVIGGCCFVIFLISGGLIGCSFSVLEYNQVGIDFDSTSQSINEEKLFHNGRHFIGLAHSFFVYPTKLLTVEFAERDELGNVEGQSGALSAGSKDGQAIEIEISFFVRLNTKEPSNVVNLYKEYRTTFMPTVISNSSRLTRRPPSAAVAPHGHPCHSHGPGCSPSSWAAPPAPSKPPASPAVALPRLRICAPTRSQVRRPTRSRRRPSR